MKKKPSLSLWLKLKKKVIGTVYFYLTSVFNYIFCYIYLMQDWQYMVAHTTFTKQLQNITLLKCNKLEKLENRGF